METRNKLIETRGEEGREQERKDNLLSSLTPLDAFSLSFLRAPNTVSVFTPDVSTWDCN